FYTRTINDPEIAAKVTARTSSLDFGYLFARDDHTIIILPFEESDHYIQTGKSTSNILRARRNLRDGSHFGLIATDRRLDDGGSGSIISHDGLIRFTPSLNLSYQAVLSHTQEPDDYPYSDGYYKFWKDHTAAFDGESFWGHGGTGVLRYNTRNLNATINYWEVSPTYRADNGFDPKNNRRDFTFHSGYMFRPKSDLFEIINPQISAARVWNFNDRIKRSRVALSTWTRLKFAQASAYFEFVKASEEFSDVQFDNIWTYLLNCDFRIGDLMAFSGYVNYGHTIARNHVLRDKTLYTGFSTDFKPLDRILLEQEVDYARSNSLDDPVGARLYNQLVYRTRLGYQITRQLSLRLVVQYQDRFENYTMLGGGAYGSDTWTVDPLLTYRINPFSIFYMGTSYNYFDLPETDEYGHENMSYRLTNRQFFMKLQYMFQM
ncbi:MAG: hypothetical protein DRP45_05165, partial [Candidatus Zixiibacteriota bacterium]